MNLWLPAPQRPLLKEGEVHVWRVPLSRSFSTLPTLFEYLSTDERERAGRFHFSKDRDRFIVARGMLRRILSRYLNTPPAQLLFSYNKYGKPALHADSVEVALRFNLSHSNDVALYALTLGRELGVDVEFLREDFASVEIAERFFSHTEVAMLRALPGTQRTQSFFNCWTRKEAYIKARGEGLSHPLDQFTVSLAPEDPARLIYTSPDPLDVERWKLFDLYPSHGYAAALAVWGEAEVLRYSM